MGAATTTSDPSDRSRKRNVGEKESMTGPELTTSLAVLQDNGRMTETTTKKRTRMKE